MTNSTRLKSSKQQSFSLIKKTKNAIIKRIAYLISVLISKVSLNNSLSDKDNENSLKQASLIISVFLVLYFVVKEVLKYVING